MRLINNKAIYGRQLSWCGYIPLGAIRLALLTKSVGSSVRFGQYIWVGEVWSVWFGR
jgi:hypothetical protein